MAGLETIALAVAHLERLQQEEIQSRPDERVTDSFIRAVDSVPAPGAQGRMVSDGTYQASKVSSFVYGSPAFGEYEQPRPSSLAVPRSNEHCRGKTHDHNGIHVTMSGSFSQVSLAGRSSSSQRNIKQALSPSSTSAQLQDSSSDSALGPVATLLARVSMVTDNLEDFFTLMEQLKHKALPEGTKPADVPKPDEIIVLVQRNDVLLGRGGETNHHVGNIQYRQLVKACQPAYLAAKRRDKPRIAAAIVHVVRARSGRFLKKLSMDNTWKDVGNTRAREKTSQALREGAPELRGTVEASRAQLLQEAVTASRAQLEEDDVEGLRELSEQRAPSEQRLTGSSTSESKRQRVALRSASRVYSPTLDPRATLSFAPPVGHHHHHHHHGLRNSLPIPNGPLFYHHHPGAPPIGAVVYHRHHPPTLNSRYHHPFANNSKRPVAHLTGTSQHPPPKKRQAVVLQTRTSSSKSAPDSVPPVAVLSSSATPPVVHNLLSSSPSDSLEKVTVSATVSAEHSEEEVRTASPASSTSSKNSTAPGRGPRVKLLKNRLEDKPQGGAK